MIFDFDDTLMATRAGRVSALVKAAADFGYPVTPEEIALHWGKPFNQLIASIVPEIEYQSFYNRYSEVMRSVPPILLPGAGEVVGELKRRGVLVMVVSSGSRALVQQDLEEGGLWTFVTRLWGYEDTLHHKPDPRVLDPALQMLKDCGVEWAEVACIGDSVADLAVARANGIVFVAVLSGASTRDDFRAARLGDEWIVDSLKDLLESNGWLNRDFGVVRS